MPLYKKATAQQAIPWIFRVVSIVCIYEDKPLVAPDLHLPIAKFGLHSATVSIIQCTKLPHLLNVIPVKPCRAKEHPSSLVVESPSSFHVARNMRA